MSGFTNSLGMRFVRITSGIFQIGAPLEEVTSRDNKRSIKSYNVKPFYIGIFPVTQKEYFMIEGNNPSYFSLNGKGSKYVDQFNTSNFPVESVSWIDANKFCQKLSSRLEEQSKHRHYRLPTEMEWEYACRASQTIAFNIGDSFTSLDGNINGNYPYNSTIIGPILNRICEVGQYPPNSHGIYDMHGNAAWQGEELPDGVLGGVITANNIARLDLRSTDLVVLSACQSGQGNATAEGLYGLQRAFKKAGVGTIVMTLWNVSDKVTTEFMMEFYERLSENNWDKRKAFEETKTVIRKQYPDPYYWAAFVMLD